MVNKLRRWIVAKLAVAPSDPPTPKQRQSLTAALSKARAESLATARRYQYPVKPPELPAGVAPPTVRRIPVMAEDSGADGYGLSYNYARGQAGIGWVGFPGYPYLANLSTRAEFRMFAQAIGTALTREWIVLNSTDTDGDQAKAETVQQKITELTEEIRKIGLREAIQLAAEQDSYYGRAQIFLDLIGHNREVPLVISDKTIKKGTKFRVKVIEAMWTTPAVYNAIDPAAPDFYKPTSWFMLGKQVHWSRLLTIITRPVLDMLKPAFNFGGMSMSQLAEPYVDNWLRTRQSVSDLISNFSITALATSMDQALQGDELAADNVFNRAELFTLTRTNKGVMLLDKEREELVQINTPLSGLAELQSQSQEQMCSVSHIPAVVLLGISPTGFGNLAEGEIRAFYDWVASLQETYWRKPIEQIINILQLTMYGMVDPDITVAFQPLYQMTPKELAEIRTADATTDAAYLDRQVLAPEEVREKLARNPESGYQGLDVDDIPEVNEEGQEEEDEDVP